MKVAAREETTASYGESLGIPSRGQERCQFGLLSRIHLFHQTGYLLTSGLGLVLQPKQECRHVPPIPFRETGEFLFQIQFGGGRHAGKTGSVDSYGQARLCSPTPRPQGCDLALSGGAVLSLSLITLLLDGRNGVIR